MSACGYNLYIIILGMWIRKMKGWDNIFSIMQDLEYLNNET